ncbi:MULTISPECIES: MBL fold metallo-hydrolase [unclassified Bacillus (in: firmicutes)]|uniref:MBL fold metallo-hydrolase n=1 Tax=unclassified Bacillus (in: firmicutes) TaxID=185979 RepID=UPI001BECD5A4|nr:MULTISPECIES: MBL fold metallo-hydrolase [unclassified Bacillus (in: firmicutes)]MBT2616168.1 MBL fold metallo-hydrolase [Bacillus sp. ISL-78]MBT2628944.1 MBL fold metallo-hydrolase [Bacillus sp. ISL-101]
MLNELKVTQITIPLPFRLDHVHCFLAEGENGWTIIDAGLNNKTTRDLWNPIIEKHDITDIIITHYHPDHFGYAGTLQQLTGADVWMTEVDEHAGTTYWEADSLNLLKENYNACGMEEDIAVALSSDESGFMPQVKPYPTVNHHLEEGMKLQFGKYEYEVLFTPGHSDGLISLYNKENSVLFSTDHILPKISPNISYWFKGLSNPLEEFFKSLKKIQKLDVEYVIPSHGKPFQNANKRIAELLDHHQDRLHVIHENMKEPISVKSACQILFGNLSIHETRFAVGETLAHLEYLLLNDQCRKFKREGKWYYQSI